MNRELETKLRAAVNKKSQYLLGSNRFLSMAHNAGLSRPELAQYLFNLMFVFGQSSEHLKLAAWHSKRRGQSALAQFFKAKLKEETGHDAWAGSDLEGFRDVPAEDLYVTNETQAVMDYARSLIEKNPRLYLGYILFAEYFTVLAGPALLDALERHNGISAPQVTALSKHAEADKPHVEEDLRAIARLYSVEKDHIEIFDVIEDSANRISESLNSFLRKYH